MIPSDISATILIDRVCHASDGTDAHDALSTIQKYTKSLPKTTPTTVVEEKKLEINKQRRDILIKSILSSFEFIHVSLTLNILQYNKLLSSDKELYVDNGSSMISEIYYSMMDESSSSKENISDFLGLLLNYPKKQLEEEGEGSDVMSLGKGFDRNSTFMSLILDFICSNNVDNNNNSNTYPKILLIRLIQLCFKYHPIKTQEEIVKTPSGFHGIVSLLLSPSSSTTTEEIRNEIILLLLQVSKDSSVIRKLLLFEDVMDTLLYPISASYEELQQGGDSSSSVFDNIDNVIVQDCLQICKNLVIYEENGPEVLFDSRFSRMSLQLLLDVYSIMPVVRSEDKNISKKKMEDMNLDEMLFGDEDNNNNTKKEIEWRRLESSCQEEEIVIQVLQLLQACFGDDDNDDDYVEDIYHKRVIKFMSMERIVSLIASLSLFSSSPSFLPPTHNKDKSTAVISAPSYNIQLASLKLLSSMAKILSYNKDEQRMEMLLQLIPQHCRFTTLDALFQTCLTLTNNNNEDDDNNTTRNSLHSISILRNMLSSSTSCVILLHSLTPPPDVYDHPLVILDLAIQVANAQHAPSALALGMICMNGGESAREMLLKLHIGNQEKSDNSSFLSILMEILQHLPSNEDESSSSEKRDVLLRLICEWSYESPSVITHIFTSVQSYDFFTTLYRDTSLVSTTKTLLAILLGISFQKFPTTNNKEIMDSTGWTKSSLFSLISHQGWTTYFSSMDNSNLESLSKTWSLVHSEQQYFITWFQKVTLSIRHTIVQHLTTSTDTTSGSNNDMNQVLKKQQNEITNLHESLSTKQKTIQIQVKELIIWKKRFDSFSSSKTQVEEEITQMKQVITLQEDIQKQKLEYEGMLQQEKDVIEKLQHQLIQDSILNEDVVQEKESLEEDLTALSTAYHTLEEMYNQENNNRAIASCVNNNTGGGEASGEDTSPSTQQQDGGEGTLEELQIAADSSSQQQQNQETATPSQILTLQNEIQQLQESGRAAEEWMSMAVQRMDELQLENTRLQDSENLKINALRLEHEQQLQEQLLILQSSTTSISSNKEEVVDDHQEKIVLKEENQKLQQKLQEMQQQNMATMQDVEKEKTILLQENQELQKQLQEQQQTSISESDLVKENSIIQEENQTLQQKLQEKKSTTSTFVNEETYQKELQEKNQHLQELEQANSAAQEWMSNAVTHHQNLVEQVDTLTQENKNLQQQQSSSSLNEDNNYKQLQDKYTTVQNQYQQIKDEKDDMQLDLEQKLFDLERRSDDFVQEKDILDKKYDDSLLLLQQSKVDSDVSMQSVKEEKKRLKSDLDALQLEFDTLKEAQRQVTTVETCPMEIDEEKEELRKELYDAKHQLQTLEEEQNVQKNQYEKELQDVQSQLREQLGQEQDQEQRKHRLEEDQLQNGLVDVKLKNDNLQIKLQELQKRYDSDKHCHAEAMDKGKSKVLEYQTWVKAAQEKEVELKADKKAAKAKCKELIQQTSLLQKEMDALKQEKNQLQKQLNTYENETMDKFQCITSLEVQIKTLQESNIGLETQNATLEMDNADLVDTISSQSDEIATLQKEEIDLTDIVIQVEQTVVDRMQEIDTLRNQLSKQKQELEEGFQLRISEYQQERYEEESLLQKEDALKQEKNQLQKQLNTYENETVDKFQCITSLEVQIKTLQESIIGLETQNATLEMDNADLVDTISSQSDEIATLQKEEIDLTDIVIQVEQTVVDRMQEIDTLRNQLSKQKQELEEGFQLRISEYQQERYEEDTKKYEDQNVLLSQQKDELETQLHDKQIDHQEKIQQLDTLLLEKDNDLTQSRTEFQALSQEVTLLQEQSTDAISKWKDRADSLEVNITNCQNEIKVKRKEAEDVISQWETHCSSLREQLEEQRQEGEEEWMNEIYKKQNNIQELEGSLAEKEEALNEAEDEISILMKELQDMKTSSAEVVNQWKERSDQLEAIITEMESTLEEQRQDAERSLQEQEASATHAITEWEKQCTSLKQQIEELEENLEEAEDTIMALEEEWKSHQDGNEKLKTTTANSARIEELEKELDKTKQEFEKVSSALDDIQSQKDELMQIVMKQKEEMTTVHQNYVDSEQVLKMEKSERNRLEALLSQETEGKVQVEKLLMDKQNVLLSLEEHMKEREHGVNEDINIYQKKAQDAHQQVNDMQTHIGKMQGEIQRLKEASLENQSDKASQSVLEVAANSLNSQLETLLVEFVSVQETLAMERETHLLAQDEISRLELDVSYLLQRTDVTKGHDDDMRKIAIQAADAKSRKERQEIITLRSRLEQVMNELSLSKAIEREIESNFISLRHETSSYEQELLGRKKELEHVTTSLEEIRQHMSNHRTIYQYRMDNLEEERVSSLQKHKEEVSVLQNKLSQSLVDIDRLQYALKESEKANAALVVTTILTKGEERQQEEEITNDISRLKLEKEHLLLASSAAAAQTEQRIREVYTAKMTSKNTELQLERELRRSAEEALEENQSQLEEVRAADSIANSTLQRPSLHEDSSNKKQEQLAFEVENLQKERESLIQKLMTMEEANKMLEQKYVSSELKSREIDKELHFEAFLSMELARLRSDNSSSSRDVKNTATCSAELIPPDHNRNNTSSLILTAANGSQEEKHHIDNDMYHVLSEMKRALLEERSMYRSLMSEHEDVLELVAHFDVTQASLQNALTHLGGEEAVTDALKNVKDNIM